MITGFETITAPLTAEETMTAHELVKVLKVKNVGKKNAITNAVIRRRMEPWMEKKKGVRILLAPPRIRKIIHHIRLRYIPSLCASSDGYYVAGSLEELKEYRVSLQERIDAQCAIIKVIDQYFEFTDP